jgi:L-alanine-DL-glutamate epimerase-like enolase superfamily enzyme
VPPIDEVKASAFTIPTDRGESDGTLEWDATTIIVVEVTAGHQRGLGYSYAEASAAGLVTRMLAPRVVGLDALAVPATWVAMVRAVRNVGRAGVASGAIAAVDAAVWDLKARVLGVALVDLLGPVRDGVDVYGSGGFTSYSTGEVAEQLAGWVEAGISRVKMKVGSDPAADEARVAAARTAIGPDAELFVDANGAYTPAQALGHAEAFGHLGVSWFEEPVSSDDLEGLRRVRHGAPTGMEVTAGEYGYDVTYFERMLGAEAVDVLQADATRCGVTGLVQAAALCQARSMPLSAHTAPALHAHVGCALAPIRHLEWFHDHVRIERMLFDGVLEPVDGRLVPDQGRPGHGLSFKAVDAQRWVVR